MMAHIIQQQNTDVANRRCCSLALGKREK